MLQQLKIREKSAPQEQPGFCRSHRGLCPPQARRAATRGWFSWAVGIHLWVSRGLGPWLSCPRMWLHHTVTLTWPRHTNFLPMERKMQRKAWNLGTELTTHPGWGAVWMLWNTYSSFQAWNCFQHVLLQSTFHPIDTALCRTMVKGWNASESQNLSLSWKRACMGSSRAAKICAGLCVDRGCCLENWKSGPTMWCHLSSENKGLTFFLMLPRSYSQ